MKRTLVLGRVSLLDGVPVLQAHPLRNAVHRAQMGRQQGEAIQQYLRRLHTAQGSGIGSSNVSSSSNSSNNSKGKASHGQVREDD